MPRPRRLCPAGFVYHVLNRANERARIFQSANDFDGFLRLMVETSGHVPMRICAFCVMPTHWHLVLWPFTDGSISSYVHRLSTLHSMQHRRQRRSVGHGHVYQGRFRSFPVEGSRHYLNVIRYVEANPMRAGLTVRAEAWRWSSLHGRMNGSVLVQPGPIGLPDNWVEIVNARPDLDELLLLRSCANAGRPYGSETWAAATANAQGLGQSLRTRGRPTRVAPSAHGIGASRGVPGAGEGTCGLVRRY
jgi:putative transposase